MNSNCQLYSSIPLCEPKNNNREREVLLKHRFLTTLNLERKKFTPQSHLLTRCFCYSNLTSKIMKMCEQVFKKRQRAPIQLKLFEL